MIRIEVNDTIHSVPAENIGDFIDYIVRAGFDYRIVKE